MKPAFKREITIVYKHYHLEITATNDQEIELKKKLQARGLAVDVKPFHLPSQSRTDDVDENSSGSSKHLKSDTMHTHIVYICCGIDY